MDIFIISVLLILILLLGFLIRLPYVDFPIDEDTGLYTYVGYFRSQGIRLVTGYWGAIPPTILYVYILLEKLCCGKIKNLRYFSNFYNLLTILALFIVTNHIFGLPEALFAALIYAVFSASPYLGAYSCHGEGFYVLPLILALLALTLGLTEHEPVYFIFSGLFVAAAFLIKIVNIVYWFSFSIFLLFNHLFKEAFYFSSAFSALLVLFFLTMIFIHRNWNRQLWRQNQIRLKECLNYIDKNLKGNFKFDFIPIWKETGSVLVLASIFFIYLFFIERDLLENIFLVWVASTLFIIAAQQVYLMYHYIPVVLSASILCGVAIIRMVEAYGFYSVYFFFPAVLILISLLAFNIWQKLSFFSLYKKDKRTPYYQKADQFFYMPAIAEHIREKSSADDYIYVWGPFVQLYRLAERRSCERYVFYIAKPYTKWAYEIFDEIVKGIICKKPVYIILTRPDFDVKELVRITGLNYELERLFFNRYGVYRLKGKIAEPIKMDKMSCHEKIKLLELLTPGSMEFKIDVLYMRNGRYEEALKEFREALKLFPNDILVKLALADFLGITGKYDEAFDIYQEISEYDSKREWLHLGKGLLYVKMEKYNEAMRELKMEERFFPGKAETKHIKGTVLMGQKKYEDALNMFRKAINQNPELEWIRLDMGLTYTELGNDDEAVRCFEEEESFFPGKAETKHGLGVFYKRQKKYVVALEMFQKATRINPSFLLAKYNLNSLLKSSGHLEEAKNGFLEILSLDATQLLKGGCCFHLGMVYLQEKNRKTAGKYFKKCLGFIPGHTEADKYLNMAVS